MVQRMWHRFHVCAMRPSVVLGLCLLNLVGLSGFSAASAVAKSCASGSSSTCGSEENLDPGFFSSYSTAFVQAEMLRDDVRTLAFRDAILGNRKAFEGKTVLDVGAGTGILSFFAAQAGAARVFAVERSGTAALAKELARANGLDNIVEVVHGLLEEIELPVSSVDIILSEWIGTFLIHEGMLDSVIYARNRWLAPGGFMLPDRGTLYLAGAEDQGEDLNQWNDFHGLNFSALGSAWRHVGAQQCAFRNSIATATETILDLDLYDVSPGDTEFTKQLTLVAPGQESLEMHSFVGWFTLGFFSLSREITGRPTHPSGLVGLNASELDTHPNAPCTHWQQTFFHLAESVSVVPGKALRGEVSVRRPRASPRDLEVALFVESHINDTFFIVGAES